jgi:hypothetical protein
LTSLAGIVPFWIDSSTTRGVSTVEAASTITLPDTEPSLPFESM